MADDWDLQAVVRGCTTNSAATCSSSSNRSTTTNTAIISTTTPTFVAAASCGGNNLSFVPKQNGSGGGNNLSFVPKQNGDLFGIRDLYLRNGGEKELQELYKPFLSQASPPLSPQGINIIPISPLSVIGGLQDPSQQVLSMSGTCRTKASNISSNSHNSRSKRRKKELKRVVEIAAEALSSDTWSWRKYGQKPIKGSPYPRGYYKCSTSKGCLARKQVERKRSDPGIFIVTYTADHNHPTPTHKNSLAGSSRHKPATSGELPSSSSPLLSTSVSGSPEPPGKIEIEGYNDDIVEDEDMGIMDAPELKWEDELFEGLGELECVSSVSNTFSQNVQVQFPWLTDDITSTAEPEGEFDF